VGLIRFERDGEPVSDEAELRNIVSEHIDLLPQRLSEMKLAAAQHAR
jgi:hypothetical protein